MVLFSSLELKTQCAMLIKACTVSVCVSVRLSVWCEFFPLLSAPELLSNFHLILAQNINWGRDSSFLKSPKYCLAILRENVLLTNSEK